MVPPDVRFCVEDITDGDPRRVGVRWCAPRKPGGCMYRRCQGWGWGRALAHQTSQCVTGDASCCLAAAPWHAHGRPSPAPRHVEITGEDGQPVEFPFSRGCSFYEVDEQGKASAAGLPAWPGWQGLVRNFRGLPPLRLVTCQLGPARRAEPASAFPLHCTS